MMSNDNIQKNYNSAQVLAPLEINDYPEKSVSKWIEHIVDAAEKYPEERLIASWFIFEVTTLLGKTVKVFINWQTEKNHNDTLGSTVFVYVNEILEYDLDKIPDYVLDKMNESKSN